MYFVLVLSAVSAITLTLVTARPNVDIHPAQQGLADTNVENNSELKYKFPSQIQDGFHATIKGILNTDHEKVLIEFPSADGETKRSCEIRYSFKDETIEVSPASGTNKIVYNFKPGANHDDTFTLYMDAVEGSEDNLLKLTWNINELGPAYETISCPVRNFSDYSDIVIKEGVKTITSLLFKFTQYQSS